MLKQVLAVCELLDDAYVTGTQVSRLLQDKGLAEVVVTKVDGKDGSVDYIKALIPGQQGKHTGGNAPTLGIIGRLGGIGARPQRIGMVSDADGAIIALSCALKLAEMQRKGDVLAGDVIVVTQICPNSPTEPHEPVDFMDSYVDISETNKYEVDEAMDAILSIDATKATRIISGNGFAITPTIREGYIVCVSEDLLDIMEWTSGQRPKVLPLTTSDITPYENGLPRINSILQPSIATRSPVVGVATITQTVVPGCATGANHEHDIAVASRFCIEVAKAFTGGSCRFYDQKLYDGLVEKYGRMDRFQSVGDSE